ncbi:type II toxin-antitoxin system SpoIISA family toxin [Pradoshia sp.]
MVGKICVALIVLFAIYSCIIAIIRPSQFDLNLKKHRRILYTIFIATTGGGVVFGGLELEDWPYVVSLASIVVFTDLAVLLTPSILRIWQAEFLNGSELLEETLKENERLIRDTMAKVSFMSYLIQDAIYYFEKKPIPETNAEYIEELDQYLEQYGHRFGLKMDVRQYEVNQEVDLEVSVQEKIRQELLLMNDIHNIGMEESRFEEYIASIYNSEIIMIEEDETFIVPVQLPEYHIIVVIKKGKGIPIEIDGIHAANLVHIYDSFM